jgi:hypothetical protein
VSEIVSKRFTYKAFVAVSVTLVAVDNDDDPSSRESAADPAGPARHRNAPTIGSHWLIDGRRRGIAIRAIEAWKPEKAAARFDQNRIELYEMP